ncbi:MAG TPA: efflux RND transporter periplasmic adaptor subunit [Stellaceae bacterium]|nr:efflux RND transporter periplasmic adaptor subunit [Stellaceae bacterium]
MAPIEPEPQQNRRPGQLSLVEPAPGQAREPTPERGRRADPAGAPPAYRSEVAPSRRRRVHWGRWAALLVLLCIAAAYAYSVLRPPAVTVVAPHRGPAVQAVYATGTVEPSVMVPISPRGMARLVELKVDEGSVVVKGQLFARLENDDLRRAIEVAEAEERYAKAQLDRQGQLVERGVAARNAYDRARADWEKATATRERAEAEARYLDLVAPADGKIIRRDGEIGQVIAPDKPLLWMSCCAPLRVSAEVDEEDIAQVRSGQEVLIRADAYPGQIFPGTVQSITPKGDPVARTYRVRISLPEDTKLMIGMTAETNIVLRKADNALLVPAGAVRQDTVWLVEDGRVSPRQVTIGAKGANEIEILSGLADGDHIVAEAAAGVKPGQAVRPVRAGE